MSSKKNSNSGSSEEDEIQYAMITDEKKRKRMISNRESARRSRMKREQYVKDLNDQVTDLRSRTTGMAQRINEISRRHAVIESENRMLRMHGEGLKERLDLLEGMLASYSNPKGHVSDVIKYSDDDYSLMDILREPWMQQQQQQQRHPNFQPQTIGGIYMF